MATYSSVLAWRIQGRGSLVGCRLWGHTESDKTEATKQQQQQQVKFTAVGNASPNFELQMTIKIEMSPDSTVSSSSNYLYCIVANLPLLNLTPILLMRPRSFYHPLKKTKL